MQILQNYPKGYEIDRAYNLAADLADREIDGWTYEVELDPNGAGEFAFVRVFDAENGFAGYYE